MTVVLELARVCVLLLFAVLMFKSSRWSRRGRTQAARWLTASFAVLATVMAAGVLVPRLVARQGSPEWKLTVCVLLLFPYCLGRFTASFTASPSARERWRHRTSAGLTLLLIAGTLVLPVLAGLPRRPLPYKLYALAFMVAWTFLSVLSIRFLWRAGRGQPTVVRRRMRTLSVGALMVNLAVLLFGSAPPARLPVQLFVNLLLMLSGWVFFVGFAPPAALRAFWRQPDLDLFHAADGQLVAALDAGAVARVIVPQAVALLGGEASFMTDREGRVLASCGLAPEEAERVAAGLAPDGGGGPPGTADLVGSLLTLRLRGGWLVVTASPVTPFYGSDEVRLFEALGHSAELALERADLYERDRAGRIALETRARQQAAVARLGQRALDGLDLEALLYETAELVADVIHAEPEAVLQMLRAAEQVGDGCGGADNGSFCCLRPEMLTPQVLGAIDIDFLTSVGNVLAAAVQRGRVEQELLYQALHDRLTGLPNRALLMDRLGQAASRGGRRPDPLAVLFLDLDRFKVVNDGLGHGAGDELLKVVAQRLVAVVRPDDTVARFGGDEFVILCEHLPGEDDAAVIARRVAEVLSQPVMLAGREVSVTASIGIVVTEPGLLSSEELLRDADIAMYRAKDRGRARYEWFEVRARKPEVMDLDMEMALPFPG